jgi:LPXTG-motif cell wall-anchored protein
MGSVTEQQIVAAIQAASGNQVAKAAATPAVVKATPTPYVAPKVVKATPTPYVAPKVVTAAEPRTQPSIQVVTATQTPATSTQTVPEFSLLGLGAPALLIGAIYLFLRRR